MMAGDNVGVAAISCAADLAEEAGRRAEELLARRLDLAAGGRCTLRSAAAARQKAMEAMHRAEIAYRAAVVGHRQAAEAYERVANALQQAAARGRGTPRELQEKAEKHWRAAEKHRAETFAACITRD